MSVPKRLKHSNHCYYTIAFHSFINEITPIYKRFGSEFSTIKQSAEQFQPVVRSTFGLIARLFAEMPVLEVRNLKDLLAGSLGNDAEIIQAKQKLLTAPGEHYGSIMLALDVVIKRPGQDEEEKLNLVAKLIPASDLLRAMFDVQVTFKKEVSAYLDAIPALIEMQREFNVPEHKIIDIFPKCYGARINLNNNNGDVDEDAAIIFENLKVQGYITADRFTGFDLAHARMIVQDIAKLHAIPIAMKQIRPKIFEEKVAPCVVPNGCFDKVPEEVGSAFHNSIMDGARQVPELEPFLPRIQKVVDAAAKEDSAEEKKPPNKLFATVVHSDYWVSNTMVLRDQHGNPLKNKIVDLQIMQCESGVRDLIFFLFTSVVNSVLDEHYDELIKLYYDTLLDYLGDFDIDLEPYTWQAFLDEVEYIGPQEFYHVGFMLKPIFTEKGKVKAFDNFQSSDWTRKDLLGDAHKRKLKDTVLAFAKRNWI